MVFCIHCEMVRVMGRVTEICSGVIQQCWTTLHECSKKLYQAYVRSLNGVLGKGAHVAVPNCIVSFIREIFPDPKGN